MRLLPGLLLGLLLPGAAALAGAQELRPWSGGATPPLVLQDLDGRPHRLEDYRGKVVLINFWATWCEPCRAEMPSMNKLRTALAGRPFAVLAVNLAEPESRIRRFMEQVPLEFPVLLDRDTAVAKAWKARILPASFLVGPDGRIRYSVLGEIDWTGERVREAIQALLPRASEKQGQTTFSRTENVVCPCFSILFFYSASSGTLGVVPLTTMPPRAPGAMLP